jgi:hypothetical protein
MISRSRAAADVVAELLGCADRNELSQTLESVTNIFASHGVDVRDIRDKFLWGFFPETEWIATWHPEWSGASTVTEDEIAACYRQLRASAESGDEETYRRTMVRLRRLQAVEAQQIRRVFDTDFDQAHVDDALRRADELLARYENPTL